MRNYLDVIAFPGFGVCYVIPREPELYPVQIIVNRDIGIYASLIVVN